MSHCCDGWRLKGSHGTKNTSNRFPSGGQTQLVSRWYAAHTQFAQMLKEDINVRDYLRQKLKAASVGRIVIERPAKNARITIHSARPGIVIGKKGEDIELLKTEL